MKVLGVCGAQGALLYPLKEYVVGNVDPRAILHSKNEEQWNLNFPGIPFYKTPYTVFDLYKPNDIDVIVGSPSCGHSSKFARSRMKKLGNPREDASLNLYIDCIEKLKPKVFLMENLPKLMDTITIEEWRKKFPEYRFIVHEITVDILGNSQKNRRRLILIGTNRKFKLDRVHLKDVYPVATPKTCGQILEEARPNLNYIEDLSDKLSMIDYRKPEKGNLTVEEVKDLWNKDFRKMFIWPMTTFKMKWLPGVYRNRKHEFPHTIRPCPRQFNHLGWPIGLEEFRIIMGWPADYKIYMDRTKQRYWMNKGRVTLCKGAVYEIGLWFAIQLKKAKPDWFTNESNISKPKKVVKILKKKKK